GKYWLEAADQSELPYLTPTPVDVEANKFKEVIYQHLLQKIDEDIERKSNLRFFGYR
ncbi:MAG: hypothetical protein UT01_C0057G0010, partial [Candidatus Daviesbacteria bacterium GW2011_GWA1_38_7]